MKTSQALADHRLIYALDTFQIYTGPIPETADDPPTGTLLCEMTGCKLCYDVWSTAWELVSGPWEGAILESGRAAYYRHTSSVRTQLVTQGVVAKGFGGDLTVSNDEFHKGQVFKLHWFTVRVNASEK